jgi:hypothetical protein
MDCILFIIGCGHAETLGVHDPAVAKTMATITGFRRFLKRYRTLPFLSPG